MVVINRKTTKFESNSQLTTDTMENVKRCYQSQNYKIWKQFTTELVTMNGRDKLLSIAKLQNLKAIHNEEFPDVTYRKVVINRKTTKFESNSQQNHFNIEGRYSCYQSQNYKIWKQFTTAFPSCINSSMLLSIAKLQNLKAIHNANAIKGVLSLVVINRKTTKFESNSQQRRWWWAGERRCYQSQNYKIWKQFTTVVRSSALLHRLLSITKLQNLKAIHNLSVKSN